MANLYIIGAGTPAPRPDFFGSCCVLEIGSDLLMFDCGPASTQKLARAGIVPTRIEHLFFTHHHSDHNADYPCFLLCRWDQSIGAEPTLKVYGPPPLKTITDRLIGPRGAFVFDWKARIGWWRSRLVHKDRGGSLPRPAPGVIVKEVRPGRRIARTGDWTVTTGRATHAQPWLKSVSYRVDAHGLSVVFTGDTDDRRAVAKIAAACDVLVVNMALVNSGDMRGKGLTSPVIKAQMARDAGARMLIVTHIGPRLAAPEGRREATAQIRKIYKGRIVWAREGMKIKL